MVDLRKGITALALLVLFAGLASAQVGGTGQVQLTCSTNVTVTPQLRNEGWTEQTGDITISCTGGAIPTVGNTIPLVNFTIFYNTTVTSRLFGTTSSNIPNEALLLVDEPGSTLPGYGPSLPQVLCTTPLTGCAANVGVIGGIVTPVVPGTSTNAPNVYQGVAASATGNAVTFFGVPVMPPTTTGTRVFRITNVRVNAVPLASGAAGGAAAVIASVAISGATSLGIQNSSLTVGYVSASLTTGAGSATLTQCTSVTRSYTSAITFAENFGTAFKTRVAAQTNTSYAGQNVPGVTTPNQNVPGAIYNSESNFVFSTVASGYGNTAQPAGLADFGTRLKATFNNIPTGVRIFVSTTNIVNGSVWVAAPAVVGGSTANGTSTSTSAVSYAKLINGENTSDGSLALADANSPFLNPPTGSTDIVGNVPLVEVTLSGGTGSAVWEVINTNPNTNETFTFGVYSTLASNTASNIPLPGVSTVNLSYAPTATSGSASNANLPRFQGDSQAARTLLTIIICRTILLYPYIVNQIGLDTGLVVANTSQDPFTTGSKATAAQSGTCTLSFYPADPAATIPANFTTATIKGGNSYADLLSAHAPGFQGYMFAVCNFQFAHGFAYISDIGLRNVTMGYLAVVLEDPGTGARAASPNCQGIAGCPALGEAGAH